MVRSLKRRASSSATATRMCRVSREANGWSQATKSAPASIMVAMKATLRASRARLAIRSVAFPFRAACRAFASSVRSARALAALNLDVGGRYARHAAARTPPRLRAERRALKAALALADGAQ